MTNELNKHGKEQIAAALHLLRQWKHQQAGDRFNPDILTGIFALVDYLGVRKEYDDLLVPFPRHKFIALD